MTMGALATSPTRNESAAGAPDFVVLGNPGGRRVESFQAALAGLGLPPARLVSYLDIIAGRTALADVIRAGSILRIESPGRDFEVERALIAEGADVVDDDEAGIDAYPRPSRISRVEALRQPFDRGLILHPRQWYLGFREVLRRVNRQREDCPPHAVMNPPVAIEVLFDKPRCHRDPDRPRCPLPSHDRPRTVLRRAADEDV